VHLLVKRILTYLDIFCVNVAGNGIYNWGFRITCSSVDWGITVYEGRISYWLSETTRELSHLISLVYEELNL